MSQALNIVMESLKSCAHWDKHYLQRSAPPPSQIKFVLSVYSLYHCSEQRQQEQEPRGEQTSK